MYRENHLKARLKRGGKGIGCWLLSSDAVVAEVLSQAGFDAFIICHEHAWGDAGTLLAQLHGAQASPTTCLVRVPSNDKVYIKRVLDVGVEGIVIPTVETADEARAAVAACRYPPEGARGVGYPFSRAADYGLREKQYPLEAHAQIMVIPIIESLPGFENLAEIVAVPGVDMVILGPGDLGASLGRYDFWEDPEIRRVIAEGEKIVRDSDCWLAGVARDAAGAAELFDRGYDFCTSAIDVWLLRDGARAAIEPLRRAAADR